MRKSLFFLSSIFLLPLIVSAQDYSGYTWYLGGQIVEFSKTTSVPNRTANTVTLAGPAAVVADPATGDILFYTDGVNIYDATNRVMPNGAGLSGGTSRNQPVVVAQVPGSTTQYYVITNSATGQIEMTIVDMSLQGNTGTVLLGDVGATKGVLVGALTSQSQAMTIVPRGTGGEFWLITHEEGSATYNVTLFTTTGPTTTTTYTGLGLITSAGNFSYNATTNQIAVSPSESNRNIEILNFDPASGTLTPGTELLNTFTSSATGIYDAEWSENGNYLYVSRDNDLLQYDLNAVDPVTGIIVPSSVLPQPNTVTASYGLQRGPDGSIYHLYQSGGVIRLGKITNPDEPATAVAPAATIDYVPVAVQGTFTTKQFPAISPANPVTVTVDFTPVTACPNVPTQFFPTVSPAADSLVWTVDGQPMSKDWSPVYTFTSTGPHDVSVTAYIGGNPTVVTKTVNVTNSDTQIQLDPEITGCHEEFTEPRVKPPGWVPCGTGGTPCLTVTASTQGTAPTNIKWYGPDGEIVGNNTLTLTPPSPGYYYLIAQGAGGCEVYAGINVKEYDVQDPRANVWYFGNGAGLDFNPLFKTPSGPVEDISNGAMNAPEGTATISDRNGQVVIYTDGESVWSRFGGNTPIATGIGGSNTSSQSSLIMAVPGDETLYYIFTTQEMADGTYEFRYTLFDLKLNGGVGGIVDPATGQLWDPATGTNPPSTVLFTKSTEKLVATGDWVIVHEYGNNTFRAYRITPTGISAPVFSSVGSDVSYASNAGGEGYMMINGSKLAITLPPDKVEIFDFDGATGEVSNPITVSVAGGSPYGVNFSPDGNRLFVTVLGSNNIIEYELVNGNYVLLGNVLNGPTAQPGAMQYGPDGQLYVAVTGLNTLGSIIPQTQTGQLSSYLPGTLTLSGTVTLGLPNFVQTLGNPIQEPAISWNAACIGTDITFSANGKDNTIDIFNWIITDPNNQAETLNDGGAQLIRNYTLAGTYRLQLTITNKCETNYFVKDTTFTVAPPPPTPPMANGASTMLCSPAGVALYGSAPPTANPNFDYLWNTTSTQFMIQVTNPGTYSVTVTDKTTGCTSTASEVVTPGFTFDLGPDLYLCQNTAKQLSVPIVGVTYNWTRNGAPYATTQSINVNTSTPGVYIYKLTVTDSNNGCVVSDQVEYTVSAIPTFTATPTNSASCGLPGSGSISLSITAPSGIPLTYDVNGNLGATRSASNINAPSGPINLTPLPADVYTVTVADQLSGCASQQSVSINTNSVSFTLAATTGCHPNLALQVSNIVGTGPFTYDIFDSSSPTPVRSGTAANSNPFTTVTLPAKDGTYTLRLTDNIGCSSSNSVLVQQNTPFTVTFDPAQLCSSSTINAVVSPADNTATFTWTAKTQGGTGNGIVSTSGTGARLAAGTWVVTATATSATNVACPGTGTTTVVIDPLTTPDFTQSDACASPVTLTATPTAPDLRYQWYRNNVGTSNVSPTLRVTSTDDNNLFQIQVTKTTTGCSAISAAKTVRVIDPFTVTINVPAIACEGTDFIVTATPSRNDVTQFQWTVNGATQTTTGPALTSRTAGTYRVIGILQNCSSPPDEGTVTVTPNPTVTMGPLQRICPFPQAPVERRTVTVKPNEGPFAGYAWFYVDDNVVSDLNSDDPTYVVDQAGTYRVQVTDDNGCSNTADVEVLEDCDPIVTGPNAFRPGSNLGDNRAFNLFTYFITDEDFKIIIFNRWGEIIYQSTDRSFKWNGAYDGSGQVLPSGTYAYVVQYKSEYHPEQGIKEKRGGVLLLR